MKSAKEELSQWYCFRPECLAEAERRLQLREVLSAEGELYEELWGHVPAVNPHRDVGRNAPCPCGSGKKFKKCCMD